MEYGNAVKNIAGGKITSLFYVLVNLGLSASELLDYIWLKKDTDL